MFRSFRYDKVTELALFYINKLLFQLMYVGWELFCDETYAEYMPVGKHGSMSTSVVEKNNLV